MTYQELYDLLRAVPFRPFRLHNKYGTSHDVRHSWQCLLVTRSLIVGEPDHEHGAPVVKNTELYQLEELDRAEVLTEHPNRESA